MLVDLALYVPAHQSASLLALATFVAIFAVAGIAAAAFVTVRSPSEWLTRLRERAARGRGVYLVMGLVVTFGFGLGLRPGLIYTHAALMLGAGFALGYDLLYADAAPLSRLSIIVVAVFALLVTLLRISGLSVYPILHPVDEPWDLSWAMSYVQHGSFSDTISFGDSGDVQRFMLPVAWWIKLVGSGFWQVRLFFFLLIIPLILLTARTAHNLFGTGWVAALVMFCSVIVMYVARIRHDIGLGLAIAASLWLYSEAIKRGKHSLHFAAGLAMGWGLFAHYHAVGFGIALTISLYFPRYVERLRRGQWLPEKDLCLYILGGLLAALTVFFLQILPDWAGFLAKRQYHGRDSLADFVSILVGNWGSILSFSSLEFVLLVTALGIALWRHTRTDIMLVLLAITLHVALALQENFGANYYLIPLTPVYALLIANLFRLGTFRSRSAAVITAAFFLLPNLGLSLQIPLDHLRNGGALQLPTPPVVSWIDTHVQPTELITADNWYYLFLTNYRFVSAGSPVPAFGLGALIWDQVAPDVVIVDRRPTTCCSYIYNSAYLESRGYHQVAEFPGTPAPIQVYEK